MLIIPAIDLKDGAVVRYTRGRFNKKVYSADPVSVALDWQSQGAKFMHVVDLDAALTGKPKNLKLIKRIIETIGIPVEVSGGIRDLGIIEKIIKFGARRVVVGTKAIEDISFLAKAVKKFGGQIALAIDVSAAGIGIEGWKKSVKIEFIPLIATLEKMCLRTIIYTDITRDGSLKGLNFPALKRILQATSIDVIVSGGVCSLEDIKGLIALRRPNLKGVIIGKALYEKIFSLPEALALAKSKTDYTDCLSRKSSV